jgi:hypothetical protein
MLVEKLRSTQVSTRLAFLFLFLLLPAAAQSVVAPPPDSCVIRLVQDFVPPTASEQSALFLNRILPPGGLLFAATVAAMEQANNQPKGWGDGGRAFGRRVANAYGLRIASQGIQRLLEYPFHEDDRYFVLDHGGIGRRFAYAVSSTILARHDDGSRGFSFSVVGGAAGAAALSTQWQPPGNPRLKRAAVTFAFILAADATWKLFHEFSPRFLGRLVP